MASMGVTFCTACGAPLVEGARFCGACGGAVAAPSPAAEPSAPRAAETGGGERRQVAILFADLSGFTELSAALDAEELRDLVGRFFDTVDGVVENYGGTVDKHIGDAVMALFGAPVAHGDDPGRAVRAALDIHEAVAGLGAEIGRDLAVHVAIASGEVVAGGVGRDERGGYTVMGDAVNLAARLDELAGPGETLISEAVWRLVSPLADCEARGEVALKGIARPVRAWRVVGLRGAGTEDERGRLVGRRAEVRQFEGVVGACRDAGRGQAVLVRGEAGIGKTRLAEEFAAIGAREGFCCHRGLVLDFGVGKGQDAVRALVRSLLDIAPGGGKALRREAAGRAVDEGLVDGESRVFLNDLLDLPQTADLRAIYDAMDNATRNRGKQAAVAELLEGASRRAPVLLMVEDVHWADGLTLGHLAAMAARVKDCPAVLLITSRIEGDPLDHAWRASAEGCPVMTVDLGPLREDEALELAGGFVQSTGRFVRNCIERADGNPLFLEQLLRGAEESEEEAVPASIQSLVLARMDRLDARDKQALQAASVIGQRFEADALRHLTNDADYTCAGLIEHHLVRPEGEGYLFAHALIRDGAHSSLLKSRARELHRRAADWFAGRDPVLRAQHLDRAGEAEAPGAYLAAAEGQAAAYHLERALELARRGLEVAKGTPDEYALTCLLGGLLHDSGSVPESVALYHSALDLAGDDVERCRAWIGLAAGMRIADEYDAALEVLARAEAAAAGHGLAHDLARLHHLRGNLYFPMGRVEECREEHEKALRFAREAGSPQAEAEALGGLGDGAYAAGRMTTAHKHLEDCVAVAREYGFSRIEAAYGAMMINSRLYLGDLSEIMVEGPKFVDIAQRIGHHRAALMGHLAGSFAWFLMADFAGSRHELVAANDLIDRLGTRRFEAVTLLMEGRMLGLEGKRTEALELLSKALDIARDTGIGFIGGRILGALAVNARDGDQRRAALDPGRAVLEAGAVGHNHLWFYPDAIDACLNAGEWDEAERYAAALEAFTRPEPLPWSDFFIARGRVLAAHGRGGRGDDLRAELGRLIGEAERTKHAIARAKLDEALAAW
jgi:class 3 adenylate cyclase/tetratricopeptide (TPR) repeat protein